jgi:hypothetical protein
MELMVDWRVLLTKTTHFKPSSPTRLISQTFPYSTQTSKSEKQSCILNFELLEFVFFSLILGLSPPPLYCPSPTWSSLDYAILTYSLETSMSSAGNENNTYMFKGLNEIIFI